MRNAIFTITLITALAGCRSPGLPPEPPEHDATNPDAGLVEARPRANPFTRSAFEGVALEGGGHEHHHHGHGAKDAAKTGAPAEGSHESHGHGAKAPSKAEAPAKGSHEAHGHAGHAGHGGGS